MIKEQKFDNCENHGLQHAWKVFEIRGSNYGGDCILADSKYNPPTEVPAQEYPPSYLKKATTHTRKCQNCEIKEMFEIEEVGQWVR